MGSFRGSICEELIVPGSGQCPTPWHCPPDSGCPRPCWVVRSLTASHRLLAGHSDYAYQQSSYSEQSYDRSFEESTQHYYEGGKHSATREGGVPPLRCWFAGTGHA